MQAQCFAVFWTFAVPGSFSVVSCYTFHDEFSTIKSEVKNRMANLYSYLLVNFVIKLIACAFLALSCMGISLFGVMNGQGSAFFPCFMLMWLLLFHYECLCESLGTTNIAHTKSHLEGWYGFRSVLYKPNCRNAVCTYVRLCCLSLWW